ncbi:SRPBCC family protein [Myxococcus landrumensis]|uniref:SRPBCC family protein n=1 Tax=Myxococcus landrumensis TaxID=2813577 RepID=A0ABX7N680_9BACT|nr:SRPBCC family protein [Myxococcus landrumus]QSQ13180.1 SRPBCC family protein [Myxococcus landrumus]
MLKKILVGLAAVILILVGVIATRPSEFSISRTATLPAPIDVVFAQVNDFHQWPAWSPWGKLDPNMKSTYTGAESGTGAVNSWTGNDQVGEGRMTIEESRPNEFVRIKLEFIKPFTVTNTSTFAFKAAQGGTEVTWTMSGHNNFVSKAFSLVMDMDKMIGKDFETGFANLKPVVEAEATKRAEAVRLAEEKAAAEKAAAEKAAAEKLAAEQAAAGIQPAVAQPTP